MFPGKAVRLVACTGPPAVAVLRRSVLLTALAAMFLHPANAGVTIWAVEDGVRVDPVSGKVLVEGRTDIHRDYPTADYRRSNLVWDGESRTVRLRSARNEFVAFQVIVESDSPVREVDVSFAKLTHDSGVSLEGRNVAIFKEWYFQVRRPSLGYEATSLGPGWYADALMPKRPAGLFTGFPFSIPDIFNNIPNQRAQAVWIDIFVPEARDQAPPGRFSGELLVTWEGGRETLPVHLETRNPSGRRRCWMLKSGGTTLPSGSGSGSPPEILSTH